MVGWPRKGRHLCAAVVSAVAALLLVVLTVTSGLAMAPYLKGEPGHSFPMSPDWGQWYWWNSYPDGSSLQWEQHDWWWASSVQALRDSPVDYHFEVEAFNPGTGGSCDRLNVYFVDWMNTPLRAFPEWRSECGDPNVREEVRLYINKWGIAAETWYGHYERWTKMGNATDSDEVNYSFGPDPYEPEDNLAKLGYWSNYNMRCTNPVNLVDGSVGGC